jgi:hypothetical protein
VSATTRTQESSGRRSARISRRPTRHNPCNPARLMRKIFPARSILRKPRVQS